MKGFLRAVLDALIPPQPDVRVAVALTQTDIERLVVPVTLYNAKWIHTLLPYASPRVRSLIRAIKFYGETSVLPVLATVAAEQLDALLDDEGEGGWPLVMVPIPSSKKRLRTRGYNQADRIARAIHARLVRRDSITYLPSALAREDRETQVRAKTSRAENIKGAFHVPDYSLKQGTLKNARVILVDDVAESGSTMADARRALLAAGAHDVIGFAITH